MTTETDSSDESSWYEYLQSDLFWFLTILIISTSIWSEGQHNLLIRKSEGQEDTKSSEAPPQPASGTNLKDQITSRLRQYLAVLLCVSPIPGKLIHGLYVLKTMWRLSLWLVHSYYPVSTRPHLLGILMFSPIAIPMLGGWCAVVGGGYCIVSTQIGLCIVLWKLEPNEQPALLSESEGEV
ncbi:hypothetical protein LB506_007571 [Fusarium annulatum]|nr:hypothetical protein LB506_007571 [Fusarium annulatum]